jgi:hypothetical protein
MFTERMKSAERKFLLQLMCYYEYFNWFEYILIDFPLLAG